MANTFLLGLFQEPAAAGEAIARARQEDIAEMSITVMSDIPYEPEMLSIPEPKGGVIPIVLLGAGGGLALGLFLTVGVFLLYPLVQGGQPLVPVPPSLIIIFEVVMLAVMLGAFFGFLLVNRFPAFGQLAYDPRISAGEIGVLVQAPEELASRLEEILEASGAHDIQRSVQEQANTGAWLRFLGAAGTALGGAAVVSLLFFYDVLTIPFPTQMDNQQSVAYLQGPRLAAPAEAVPIQGPVVIGGQPASEPVAATQNSLQRGQVLYGINCALCHGDTGGGDGPLSKYFSPAPPDLTSSDVQEMSAEDIFMVITDGRGAMPSLAENLGPVDRWDVANYLHSLGTGGE